MLSASAFNQSKILSFGKELTDNQMLALLAFPKRQILDSSQLKEFADDIFKLDENGRKFFKWIENTVGKGEIVRHEKISPFPTLFSEDLYRTHVKTRACLGKG